MRALLLLLLCIQAVPPEDPTSPVYPRRFGSPGGLGRTRGWYVWESFHRETGRAEIRHEQSGERYTVRVLPWATTYRHLAYGAGADELLPGERVNLFLEPEGAVRRAYLVHFQDEICQMKGHGHSWKVEEIAAGGRGFTARGMNGDQPLDGAAAAFVLDQGCRIWRGGKQVQEAGLALSDRLYLTWCQEGEKRVVKVLADAASLEALQAEAAKAVKERAAREGLGGFLEKVEGKEATLLVFATHWAQARELKAGQGVKLLGQEVRVVSAKNLGAYGSGATEVFLSLTDDQTRLFRESIGGKVVRLFP